MPTPTGLPKPGEIWERTIKRPPNFRPESVQFIVLERRGSGSQWSLRVYLKNHGERTWVDAGFLFGSREFQYIGVAGPKTKKRLGLG